VGSILTVTTSKYIMHLWLVIILSIVILPAYAQDTSQPQVVFSAISENDGPVAEQMEKAREALRNQDYDTAITIFNTVLLLPPNKFTQEAQARIGSAYERSNKPVKAIAEYNAYIAIYPKSDYVASFRRKILALEIIAPSRHVSKAIPDGPRQIDESKVEASSSSYYIASGDASSLISNINVNGVFKKNEYTTRMVVKENIRSEIKPKSKSKYTLNVATAEIENNYQDWEIKVGRQAADYGTLAKFDGGIMTFNYGKETEYTLVLGKPLMGADSAQRKMYGGHLHHSFNNTTSTTMWYNHQTADSFEERSAMGGDLRYFKDALSIYTAVEYDIAYKQLNSTTWQAHKDADTYRWFVLYDRRKSPVLYADKALKLGLFDGVAGQPYNSIAEALRRSGMTSAELRDYIVSETAVTSQFAIGGAVSVNVWTLGGDFQSATMSGTPSEPQDSTVRSVSLNAFNPKVFNTHSINAIASYSTEENGLYSLTLLDSTNIEKIRLDTTMRVTNRQSKLISFSTHYKVTDKAFLELQLMLSKIRDEIDKTFILGFRYEF
jgi:tetratricopeptide (TPR) repeat protein